MKTTCLFLYALLAYTALLAADDEVKLTVRSTPPTWEVHLPGHLNRVYFLQSSKDLNTHASRSLGAGPRK